MASVATGSRLVIHLESGEIVARCLRPADLDDDWVVPVLLDAAGLPPEPGPWRGVAEFFTAAGPVCLGAEIIRDERVLVVRTPGLPTAAFTEQRRENVRGSVQLPIRGTVLASASDPDEGAFADLTGVTASVSAGGLAVTLEAAAGLPVGTRIYVELSMPGGDLAPCVLSVVASENDQVRARFIDISPLDRERLVRLVFARQRAELAQRRL